MTAPPVISPAGPTLAMLARIVGGLTIAFLTGFALAAALWPIRKQGWPTMALRLALACGIGLGVSSAGLFLTLSAPGGGANLFFIADAAMLLVALFAWRFKTRGSPHETLGTVSPPAASAVSRIQLLLGLLLLATVTVSVIGFVRFFARKPHGEFDAWTVWNLRARFLFRGGEHWADMLSPLLANYQSSLVTGPVSKPDYPLFLPAAIARLWQYAGSETPLVPELVAGIFTFATAALLIALLARSRGTTQGWLAGLVLLGTPAFVAQGAYQFADVPLGFFFLATLGLLHRYDCFQKDGCLVLAGATASLGAWMKNEGLVLLVIVLLVRWFSMRWLAPLVILLRHARFLEGMAPILATLIYFKLRFAVTDDMVAGQGINSVAERFASPVRYATVGRAFVSQTRHFGNWLVPVLLLIALYALLVGVHPRGKEEGSARLRPMLTVLLAVTGYLLVYVGTPHQLDWRLRFSLDRLLMQLWPAALFVAFLLLNTPEEAARGLVPLEATGDLTPLHKRN